MRFGNSAVRLGGLIQMTYRDLIRRSTCFRALAMVGMTAFFLVVGAILLPPKGSNVMPPPRSAVTSR